MGFTTAASSSMTAPPPPPGVGPGRDSIMDQREMFLYRQRAEGERQRREAERQKARNRLGESRQQILAKITRDIELLAQLDTSIDEYDRTKIEQLMAQADALKQPHTEFERLSAYGDFGTPASASTQRMPYSGSLSSSAFPPPSPMPPSDEATNRFPPGLGSYPSNVHLTDSVRRSDQNDIDELLSEIPGDIHGSPTPGDWPPSSRFHGAPSQVQQPTHPSKGKGMVITGGIPSKGGKKGGGKAPASVSFCVPAPPRPNNTDIWNYRDSRMMPQRRDSVSQMVRDLYRDRAPLQQTVDHPATSGQGDQEALSPRRLARQQHNRNRSRCYKVRRNIRRQMNRISRQSLQTAPGYYDNCTSYLLILDGYLFYF